MSDEKSEIDLYLGELKTQLLSSPAGIHWENFRKHLQRCVNGQADDKFPTPLILGSAIASHAVKHERLREQLEWAERNGCLEKAFSYLRQLPSDAWNISRGEDWNEEHPWTRGEW